jgi:CO/xanthine dehydrogenase Mo-binding subunit
VTAPRPEEAAAAAPSRRDVLRGALAGGALGLAVTIGGPGCGGGGHIVRRADETGDLAPNAYITILASGRVALAVNKAEIGQGVTTAYATLVAEELEVDPDEIEVHFADSLPVYRTSGAEGVPLFRVHATGGSTSTREAYVPLRRAAAAAREMLVAAAAAGWGVPASACAIAGGRVTHPASGRSAGLGELTRAAARLPVPARPAIKRPEQFRLIGKRSARVDARAKVTGQAKFGIDVTVPAMVCAYPIHGPRFGARPEAVRAAAARAVPGVIDVVALPWGVAVVAERYWQALRAARLVEVDWTAGPAAGLDTDRLAAAARDHRGPGGAVRETGNAPRAIARARSKGQILDAVYEAPHLAHAPLEPQNCVVAVRGDAAEVWAPCQIPTVVQEAVADALGISADDVLVHTTYAGGGFGRRLLGDFAAQAAQVARAVKRPVKLIWSRASDLTQGYYRPAASVAVRGALDERGRISALECHVVSQPITLSQGELVRGGQPGWIPAPLRRGTARTLMALAASNTGIDMFATEGASDTPYRVPSLRVAYTPVRTAVPVAFWRSVGHSYTAFAMESAIDELAALARQDPLAFRLAHLGAGTREARVLAAAAELAGWDGPRGPAVPAGHARGIARHTAFGTECAEVAEVTLVDGRIRVTRVWCAIECGVAVNPDIVRAQIEGAVVFGLSAALDQRITIKDGAVQETNYDRFPVLRIDECPRIEVAILESRAEPTGVGVPRLPPIAPAVASAVAALTGARLRALPLQAALAAAGAPRAGAEGAR